MRWLTKHCTWTCKVKAPTLRPDSNQQPAAFIRPLCCLSSDPFGRKLALKHTASKAANYTGVRTLCACARLGGASLVAVIQNMKAGNDGTKCIEKQSARHRVQRRTQYSAPPTHRADSLAHRQSEWSYS